ncbi:MAG: hypothetical protein Q4G10_06775 [Bacteroidia bacterium]|nr:hypothetical protein [Bacteroidia bacterium]
MSQKLFLLPYKFKKFGMYMFIPFCAICLWCLFSGEFEFNYMQWPCISLFFQELFDDNTTLPKLSTTDPINEIGMFGLLISMCFIALSKEKDEDEMTALIRMKSFVFSFWVMAAILAFSILFVYGIMFMEFAFVAVFLVFLIYIVKFNFAMRRIRREGR